MPERGKTWQTEYINSDYGQTYRLKKKIISKNTPYQKIELVETFEFGKMLLLDGAVQTSEKDEFIYHEMLAHPALLTHPKPDRVLIIGGGDGGTLRRVLEHPVKEVIMVEMDQEVVKLSRAYLSSISKQAFKDKRATIIIDDGFSFLKNEKKKFDLILVDSTDPVGKATVLFSEEFYKSAFSSLNEEGMMVTQSGSVFYQLNEVRQTFCKIKKVFTHTYMYLANIPTYPGSLWSFTLGSKLHMPPLIPLSVKESRLIERNIKTRYYNLEIDLAAFALPTFLKEALNESDSS